MLSFKLWDCLNQHWSEVITWATWTWLFSWSHSLCFATMSFFSWSFMFLYFSCTSFVSSIVVFNSLWTWIYSSCSLQMEKNKFIVKPVTWNIYTNLTLYAPLLWSGNWLYVVLILVSHQSTFSEAQFLESNERYYHHPLQTPGLQDLKLPFLDDVLRSLLHLLCDIINRI